MEFPFITDKSFRGFAERLTRSYIGRAQLDLRRLTQLGDEFFANRFTEGGVSRTYLYDLVQAAYNLFLMAKFSESPIRTHLGRAEELVACKLWAERMEQDLSLLPTHTIKDGKKYELQQFSTPPQLGLLAAYAANLHRFDIVGEPSAGLGGLAVMAKLWSVKTFAVNEIDPVRYALLADVMRGTEWKEHSLTTRLNAGMLSHNEEWQKVQPTVILMNPPFSIDRGTVDPMTAARHVEQALKVLRVGGRLVAILPGGIDGKYTDNGEDGSRGMLMRSAGRFGDFWKKLNESYTIRCDIGIKGDVYYKFGTTIRTRLVVIDKVMPPADSWNKVVRLGDQWHTPIGLFEGLLPAFHKVVVDRPRLTLEQEREDARLRDDKLFNGGSAHKLRKHMDLSDEKEEQTFAEFVDERLEREKEQAAQIQQETQQLPPAPDSVHEPLEIRQLKALGAQVLATGSQSVASTGLVLASAATPAPAPAPARERYVPRDQVDFEYKGKLGVTYAQVATLLSRWGINRLLFTQPSITLTFKLAALKEELIVETRVEPSGIDWLLSLTHYSTSIKESDITSVVFAINGEGALRMIETLIARNGTGSGTGKIDGLDIGFGKEFVAQLVQDGFDEAELIDSKGLPEVVAQTDELARFMEEMGIEKEEDILIVPGVGMVGTDGQRIVPASRGDNEKAKESQWHLAPDETYDPEEEGKITVQATINVVPDQEAYLGADEGANVDDVFQNYQPFARVEGSVDHTVPLVESGTMRMAAMPMATAPVYLPRDVVSSGALSSMQMENVIYAAHNHSKMLPGTNTPTAFFCGDGTGTGKGRSSGAIIMHNDYLYRNTEQRRVRAVWVTVNFSLLDAARKDWHDLGGDREFVVAHSNLNEQVIELPGGIILTTYATMRMVGEEQDKVSRTPEEIQAAWDAYELRAQEVEDGRKVRKEYLAYVKRYGHRDLYPSEAELILRAGGKLPEPGESQMPTIPAAKKPLEQKLSVNRVQQIVDWNPDIIVFDESHKMGNAVGKGTARGGNTTSQRGLMGLELLRQLPQTKVVYMSATGATEVHNIGYAAERMGLCGTHVPAFPTVSEFIAKITKGGMLGMELVATDMKRLGVYRATNISYAGTSFELLMHPLTKNQRKLYDNSTYYWRLALDCIRGAFTLNGTSSQGMAAAMSGFWGAAQRFYNQILISQQAPTAIAYAIKQMQAGHAVVVQLVNTNEAATERAVGDALAHEANLDDLDITPKDTLMQYLKQSFPTLQYEPELDENNMPIPGKMKISLDADGNPIQNPDAVRMRDRLLKEVASMRAPQGALDMFLEQCAAAGFPMAEITGRKQRYLMKEVPVEGSETGETTMMRHAEPRSTAICDAEMQAFMNDELQCLIFSDAGNTGRSMQSDKRAKNQRRRIHMVLQPGWRADNAIQGMGRTHRTNQRVPPHYVLISTDMPGQKRFVTSIARRIEQLGSMTKGNRRAANSGLFADTDNLETKYALQAMHQIFYTLWMDANTSFRDAIGAGFYELQDLMGLDLVDETVDPPQLKKKAMSDLSMVKFLNRLLLLPTRLQERLFAVFESLHESAVENAKQLGTFDRGVEKISAQEVTKISDKLVYTDPVSGARTRIVKLKVKRHRNIITFDEMMGGKYISANERGWNLQSGKPNAWVVNQSSSTVGTVWDAGQGTTRDGNVTQMLRIVTPESTIRISTDEYIKRRDMQINEETARLNWAQAVRQAKAWDVKEIILVTGAILPVWDRLGNDTTRDGARIYVAETTATATEPAERILGREILAKNLEAVLQNLGVVGKDALRLTAQEAMSRVMQEKGLVLTLANKWKISRRRMSYNSYRMQITGPQLVQSVARFPQVLYELDGNSPVYIVDLPADQKQRLANFKGIVDRFPIVQLSDGLNVYDVVDPAQEEALKLARQDELVYFPADHLIDWQETIMPWPPLPFEIQGEQQVAETDSTVIEQPTAIQTEAATVLEEEEVGESLFGPSGYVEDAVIIEDEPAYVAPVVEMDQAARDLAHGQPVAEEPQVVDDRPLTPEQVQQRLDEITKKYPRGSVRNRLIQELYGQQSFF